MPIPFVAFLILLTLKLTEVVDWSWWIITLPLWIGLAIIVTVLIVGGALAGLAAGIVHVFKK